MHHPDIHVYEFIARAFYFSDNKRKLHCKFSLSFFYLFLPCNRCKFCWVHSRKWMSEVYKVGDTLLISFLLSTPFLRSISFRNRTRYYFANNSSLRFRRNEKNIDLVLSFPLDAKKCIRKIQAFFHISHVYISIDVWITRTSCLSAFVTGILFHERFDISSQIIQIYDSYIK